MVIYSHSRLSTFEQCRLKFKYRYIDNIIPEVEKTIESHLGTCIHDTLEWLYNEIIKNSTNVPKLETLIDYYTEKWIKDYNEEILIVKKYLNQKDYFNKGIQFLIDYYFKHKPFSDGTIECEKKILIDIDGDKKYLVQGFIDRLARNPHTNELEIHDYKTANVLPTQDKMDKDRQLALYSIAIKELYGDDKNVCLTWHYLAHNVKICSRRTNEQLEQLKKEIKRLIDEIESTEFFYPTESVLCHWCEYKSICPLHGGRPNERQKKLEDIYEQRVKEQEEIIEKEIEEEK